MRLFDKKFRVELYDVSVRASEMSRFQREIDENINSILKILFYFGYPLIAICNDPTAINNKY